LPFEPARVVQSKAGSQPVARLGVPATPVLHTAGSGQ
jgi:hypothetical protein